MISFAILTTIFLIVFLVQKHKSSNDAKEYDAERKDHHQMLNDTIDFQEKELDRIAEDLHDDIGSMLSAAKLKLDPDSKKDLTKEEILEAVNSSHDMIAETIVHIRKFSRELMPSSIKNLGLVPALEDLIGRLKSATSIEITFESKGEKRRIDPQKELGIYRIAQELLNNAMKHSEAEKIAVTMEWRPQSLQLTIWDNGRGFDYKNFASKSTFHNGLGLNNIQCRALAINAYVNFHSEKNNGTRIEIGLNL